MMGGWGGHVNVPCISYVICCYAAEISGVATVCARRGGVGWGGGDVNVPGTSYGICSYAAEISGVVATLQRCLVLLLRGVHEGMGVGMLTFLLLRTLYVATLQRSLVLMLRCVHGGLGWGGVGGHCNVPGISYVIMCLRCWDLWCCCYAAELSGVAATVCTRRVGVGRGGVGWGWAC